MNLTIYCMGDINTFIAAINAVSMVFQSSLFDPGKGAGIVVVGLLLAIFTAVFSGALEGKLNYKPFVLVLLLFYGGIVPKERLQVEDIYSGQIGAVDNVPLIIALPGAIVAALTKATTDQIETFMATTGGNYVSMSQEGFLNPLKVMLSARDPMVVERHFPELTHSITDFVRFCAPTDPAFRVSYLQNTPDVIGYLAGTAPQPPRLNNVQGITTYYDLTSGPMGIGLSCAEAQTRLAADASAAITTATTYNQMLSEQMAGEVGKTANPSALGPTVQGLTQSYNAVTNGIAGNLQNAQQFMTNLLAFSAADGGLACINRPQGTDASNCMSALIQKEALARANTDAAAQAGIFTKTMTFGMNFMLLLFYAFSPVIIAVALLTGAHGIKVIMSFVLFAVWTQSWMPVAVIINYLIQLQVNSAMAALPHFGINMADYATFYSILTNKIGIASTMLASVPMLTLGLISGSIYSMTNLAGTMSGKDYVDEEKASPKLARNSAVVDNGSQVHQGSRTELISTSGGMNASNVASNTGFDPFSTVDLAESAKKAKSQEFAHVRAARGELDRSLAATYAASTNQGKQTDWTNAINKTISASDARVSKEVDSWVSNNKTAHSMGHKDQESLKASLGLMLGGFGAAADKMLTTDQMKQASTEIMKSKAFSDEKSRTEKEDSLKGFAKNLSTRAGSILSADESDQVHSSMREAENAENRLAQADQWTREVGLKNSQSIHNLGGNLVGHLGNNAASFVEEAIDNKNKADFDREKLRILGNLPTNIRETGAAQAGAALQALAQVDPSAFLERMQRAGLAGMGAMKPVTSGVDGRNFVTSQQIPDWIKTGALGDAKDMNGVFMDSNHVDASRLSGVGKRAAAAKNLHGSAGANLRAIEAQIAGAEKFIETSMHDKDHLMHHDKIAAEQQAMHDFLHECEVNGWLNDHGHIAGMANAADGIEQLKQLHDDHPYAATALEFLVPGGLAFKGAKIAKKAIQSEKAVMKYFHAEEEVVKVAEKAAEQVVKRRSGRSGVGKVRQTYINRAKKK